MKKIISCILLLILISCMQGYSKIEFKNADFFKADREDHEKLLKEMEVYRNKLSSLFKLLQNKSAEEKNIIWNTIGHL